MEKAERTVYFDYLRVFAVFAVIILHVSSQNFYTTDVNGFDWQISNFYYSIVKWCVPVFVMISGALFLDREIPLKKLYTKYILRMAVSYIVWSAVYFVILYDGYIDKGIVVLQLIGGYYHMWFIPMIIGLYICVPITKAIADNDKAMRYYLIAAFVFAFLIPWGINLTDDFARELIIKGVSALNSKVSVMGMNMVLGYTGYFLGGYYLSKVNFSKRQRMVIYLLGIFGFAVTMSLNMIVAFKTQQFCEKYNGYFNVGILLESIAVFVWFKYNRYTWSKLNFFIRKLSKYSFGAYLVHALIIALLDIHFRLSLKSLTFNSGLAVLYMGTLVFIVSFSISAILNQIPVVKKFMV